MPPDFRLSPDGKLRIESDTLDDVLNRLSLEGELRLEADIRDDDLRRGMQACVADPLWLLGRQWQVGELRGEDAGSPIRSAVTLQAMPTVVEGVKDVPAEVAVEREPVANPGRFGFAVDLGLRVKAALIAIGGAAAWTALRSKYPLAAAPVDADPTLRLKAARSLDALALLADLANAQKLVAPTPPELRKTLTRWAEAARAEWTEPAALTTWQPGKLAYAAKAASPDGGALQTRRYTGDRLDWYSFEISTPPPKPALRPKQTAIPSPVQFAGMPASRWWEIEDGKVHLLDVEGESTDFIETFVAEFATLYGDDWFVVPVTLYYGGLHRVTALAITDVFGVTDTLPALARKDGKNRVWRMFELTGDPEPTTGDVETRPGPWLYLPDALLDTQYGPPIEEVRLLRDEQSNLGWGVERVVEGPDGRPQQRAAVSPPPERRETWAWHAMTSVPRGWIPLLPARAAVDGPDIVLQRARLPGWGPEDGARGAILGTGPTLVFPEAEIQATGTTVQRLWQRSRHSDGRVLVWLGRRQWSAAAGAGVCLAFDRLER